MKEKDEYFKILTMSNKEAADILRELTIHMVAGRGSGKSVSILKHNVAFSKAIKCLEDHPDTATDIVAKESRDLLARMKIYDEYHDHTGGNDVRLTSDWKFDHSLLRQLEELFNLNNKEVK